MWCGGPVSVSVLSCTSRVCQAKMKSSYTHCSSTASICQLSFMIIFSVFAMCCVLQLDALEAEQRFSSGYYWHAASEPAAMLALGNQLCTEPTRMFLPARRKLSAAGKPLRSHSALGYSRFSRGIITHVNAGNAVPDLQGSAESSGFSQL